MHLLSLLSLVPLASSCLHEHPALQSFLAARQQNNPQPNPDPEPLLPVHSGDRFANGSSVPRGIGSRRLSHPVDFPVAGIMNTDETTSALYALREEFGREVPFEVFTLPELTFEGREMVGARVGGGCDGQWKTYLTGGMHPRERGVPDALIYFVADLLWANRESEGLIYGNTTFSAEQVTAALDTGIVFVPVANPDGLAWDHATDTCWRKNRNTISANLSEPATVGVDLNRNLDFAWNFTQSFLPGIGPASFEPLSEIFAGTSAFSEPETRNLKWVADEMDSIGWYVDVHCCAGLVIYSWGDDTLQTTDPDENFYNPDWDGLRGDTSDTVYESYMEPADLALLNATAAQMYQRVLAAGGRPYGYFSIANLYPTSGSTADYFTARGYLDPGRGKINGFGFEAMGTMPGDRHDDRCFGYPTKSVFVADAVDIGVAMMTFMGAAGEG